MRTSAEREHSLFSHFRHIQRQGLTRHDLITSAVAVAARRDGSCGTHVASCSTMKSSIVLRTAGALLCACACTDGSVHPIGTVANDHSKGTTTVVVTTPPIDAAPASTTVAM